MATRLYFHYGVTVPISPYYDAAWEKGGSYRFKCSPVKQGTAFTEISSYESSVSVNYDTAIAQIISDPLAAQTISGTVKLQILAREALAAADLGLAMVVRVVSALGVPRGTLLSYFPGSIGTELNDAAAVNRTIPDTAITPLAVQKGDRLVIEIGFRAYNVATTTYYAYFTVGDAAATDLPEDEIEEAYLNPWIEFSGSLVFSVTNDFAAAGGWSLSGKGALGSSTIVELESALAADGYMSLSGDCEIKTIPPTQFLADGHMELSGLSVIDSIPPNVTHLAASGHIGFYGDSAIASVPPGSHTTDFVADGYMAFGGKSVLGDEKLLHRTDFVATGGYALSGSNSKIGTIQPANKVTDLVATGGFEFGGCPCILDSPVGTITALAGTISYILSGKSAAGFIVPLVTAFVATGGWVLGSSGVDAEETVFEAWVLNGQAFEPSVFSKFRFNSFAQRGAQTFAAGEYGIYLLGGDDDDGEAFHTGTRIGPANFGSDREKRLRGIQMGNCGPNTKVKVVADAGDGGEGVFTPDLDPNRVVVSRNIQGREFTIDIQDFQELSHLEIMPLKLARR